MSADKPQNRIVEAQFVAAAAKLDQLPPPQCLEIAFAGRSNVGKSTLMNAVMGRKNLVRTSSTPGCTRTISFFSARMSDKTETMLVDLPGYGYAERSRDERRNWADLIESYLLHRPSLRGVVLLVDARRDFQEDDGQLLDLLAQSENPNRAQPSTFIVATKLDQIQKSRQAARLRALREQAKRAVFGLSALELSSVADFWAVICRDWLSPTE